MKILHPTTIIVIALLTLALLIAQRAFADEPRYLGQLSANPYGTESTANPYGGGNPYDADSINNEYGRYGNPYSPDSINNPFGAGSPYRNDSPTNPYGEGLEIRGAH